MGVTKLSNGKFRARVYEGGREYNVGIFDTQRKAVLAVGRWHKNQEQLHQESVERSQPDYIPSEPDVPFKNGIAKPSILQRLQSKLKK